LLEAAAILLVSYTWKKLKKIQNPSISAI